jgi:hypothetical protein
MGLGVGSGVSSEGRGNLREAENDAPAMLYSGSEFSVPAILARASRYYLGIADVWNRYFRLITQEQIAESVGPLLEDDSSASGS